MPRVSAFVRRRRVRQPRRVARLRAALWAVEDALVTRAVRGARGLAQSFSMGRARDVTSEQNVSSVEGDRIRVLRWVFARGADKVTCELALSSDDAFYELKTESAADARKVERFVDVVAAFDRQSDFERSLLADGWTLESYESALVDRVRTHSERTA